MNNDQTSLKGARPDAQGRRFFFSQMRPRPTPNFARYTAKLCVADKKITKAVPITKKARWVRHDKRNTKARHTHPTQTAMRANPSPFPSQLATDTKNVYKPKTRTKLLDSNVPIQQQKGTPLCPCEWYVFFQVNSSVSTPRTRLLGGATKRRGRDRQKHCQLCFRLVSP